MYKLLIVEDQEINALLIQDMLLEYFQTAINKIIIASNLSTAEQLLDRETIDLVFLDIHLPDGDGLSLLPRIERINAAVIFITAYDQYALQAFQAHALHYLLKPINVKHFKEAVERFLKSRTSKNGNNNEGTKLQQYYLNEHNKIAIPTKSEIVFLSYKDIIYLSADGGYTNFHLLNQRPIFASKGLGHFEKILSSFPFYRVHEKTIVNITHIEKYHKGRGGLVEMVNNDKLAVSVRRKPKLIDFLQKHYNLNSF